MYIRKRFISAGYKILVSLLAIAATSMLFVVYGVDAWRLFSTWSMLLIATYFFLSGIVVAISKKRETGKVPCVMLQGMCITASATLVLMECLSFTGLLTVPGVGGFGIALINFIVPVFVLFDWILFSKKGFWHVIDPWYWLAWIICYFTVMTLTANYLPESTLLLYPYEFLNYPEIGLDQMAWWVAIFVSLELAFGYLMLVLDLLIGGRLSKYIVLPKIKTIIVEEKVPLAVVDESETKEDEKKTQNLQESQRSKLQKTEPVIKTDSPRIRKATPKTETSRKRTITITPPTEESAKDRKDTQLQESSGEDTEKSTSKTIELSATSSTTPTKNNTPIIRKEALRQKAKTEQARQKVVAQDIDKDSQQDDVKNESSEALVVEEITVREVKEVIMGKDPESTENQISDNEDNSSESK